MQQAQQQQQADKQQADKQQDDKQPADQNSIQDRLTEAQIEKVRAEADVLRSKISQPDPESVLAGQLVEILGANKDDE